MATVTKSTKWMDLLIEASVIVIFVSVIILC